MYAYGAYVRPGREKPRRIVFRRKCRHWRFLLVLPAFWRYGGQSTGVFILVKKIPAKNAGARKSAPAKKVRRVIKPWTKDDVRALKAHSKARTPVAKISKQMKRTVGALRRRAGILGIGLGQFH